MSTDPSSSNFDPLLALYSETSEPPKEGVKVYDNIAMFEAGMRKKQLGISEQPGPSKKENKSFSQKRKVQEEAEKRDVGKLKELMETRRKIDLGEDPEAEEKKLAKEALRKRKPKPRKNLLTSMTSLSNGPYSIVYDIVRKHVACNVYVRDFCGLRGVCQGYVVAYDRYLNLAMIDVSETFRKPPLGKVAKHQKSLSVAALEKAVKSLSLGGGKAKPVAGLHSHHVHRGATGARILPKRSKPPPRATDESRSHCEVKTVGPELFKNETFHGGAPQLYHRHMDHLLVRGDSVVMICLKK